MSARGHMTYRQLYNRSPAPLRILILLVAGLHGMVKDMRDLRRHGR